MSIKSVAFAVFVLLGASLLAFAQSGRVQQTPTPPRDDDTVRVSTEEIKLNVLAFDDKGEFFRDVTANDLVIVEGDILHQPASVRRLPANVLIVMDTGGELRSVKSLDKTRSVARRLIEALQNGDSVALMQYSDKAEVVGEWTSDKGQILAALKRTNFGRKSVFVDALRLATDLLLKDSIENKHLVLITDGTDSNGRPSAKFDTFQRLLATDISVHVLSFTSMEAADIEPRTKRTSNSPPRNALPDEVINQLPPDVKIAAQRPKVGPTVNMDRKLLKTLKSRKADLEVSQQQLEKLAENTNGEFILPDSIDEMIEKSALVARMIDSTYVVTYVPKIPVVETRGASERNIDVTSKRSGLIVQARRKLIISSGKK
ncbi:MAG: VWA domain-containing protein [Pyrinomonadaceae bacterium]